MTHKQSLGNKITSVFLTVALLLSMIPLTVLPTFAAPMGNRIADPSTMNDYLEFFLKDGKISTENAGGVWMDKSVFTDASAFAGLGITQDKQDSFLVAMSAIAANMNITGMSNIPTDTMLVLDVSGSMNDDAGHHNVADDLVRAANESIAALLATNKYNRVGVVLYSGPEQTSGSASSSDAVLILPLNRYTAASNGEYLSYSKTGTFFTTEEIGVKSGVYIEGTTRAPGTESKTVAGATYIQKGIILAMDQFIDEGNAITVEDPVMGTLGRKPIIVLMSDGAPTVGSTNFTNPTSINVGSGNSTNAALGFISQLSASYAKAKVEEKYKTDALFYTLGLGISNDAIAVSVMDPDNARGSTAVGDYWSDVKTDRYGRVTYNGYDHVDVGETISVGDNRFVTKISTPLEQNYVNQYFPASTTDLTQVFRNIISEIQLQSAYFPTLVADNEDLSGYISFVDRIGEYMTVTDIKGILIDDHLFSGADLSSNFVSGGGNLGTYDNPTALGIEMVAAVCARLGIDNDDVARTLIALAYANGQLSYTNEQEYSNYIGWYANAAGEFLGFYDEGTTVLPAATGNPDTDPAFTIRSYGYLGAVDESHGVAESDMMYATVQVRRNIATGEELVTFAVPAALIPIISYNISLDKDGELSELTVSGADKPIRLVYEVALDDNINSFNVKEVVSSDYLAENTNADGSVNFYTNQWEHENTTGYGTVNTYSYFNPSRQNDKYYYLEDAPVYSNANGTLYTGAAQPDETGTFYRSYKVYKNDGDLHTEIVYRPLSAQAKATALPRGDGTWYIPRGNVHVNLDGYTVEKTQNLTGTLGQSVVPFVDTTNHAVNEEGYDFYVGATLGNNGKMVVMPETGIKLTKTMAAGAATPDGSFAFVITNVTNSEDDSSYPAWLILADGREMETRIQFSNGTARILRNAGDVLYIGGMTPNDTFRIVEEETAEYVATVTGLSADSTVTVGRNEIKTVAFVNDDRGAGNLTVAKEVEHDFGQDYNIPADKVFTMQVTLSGIGTANAVFTAEHSGNSEIASVTTDADGKFTVALKHEEQLEIFGLPAGTLATVVEQNPAAGFTPIYWDNGQLGDGQVTIADANTVSVIVVNDYEATEVFPVNINVSGRKLLRNQNWQQGYSFDFVLQKLLDDGSWQELGTAQASYGATEFTFANAFANEKYEAAGTYYYRVIEIEPETPLGGFAYDKTVHSFSVIVGDANMDGQLEITDVIAFRPDTTEVVATATGWDVDVAFTNVYSTSGNATVVIDLNKTITNNGGSAKSPAGYTFGLYDGENLVYTSPETTGRGFARFVLSYTETGTYQYTLKEIVPETVPAGWTYSNVEIPVTVVVSDDGDGTISAIIYTGAEQPANAGTSITANFTNTYDPADEELIIDFVSKEISGRDLANGEFKFEVQNQDGTKVLEGTNDAAGKVTFNGTLKFDKVGNYFYNIVETSADGNGVIVDKTTYRVSVTVTDADGQLNASYVLVNATGDKITFKNTYKAMPVEHSIVGSKVLNGRNLLNDEFTFVLTEVSYNGEVIQNPTSYTAKNFSNQGANIVFPSITYDQAGTYVYTVSEVLPAGGSSYGIVYDTSVYTVSIVVADNGVGNLEIESETVSGAGDVLKFENNYKANPTSAQFTGEKSLVGKVDNNLAGGEYEFELYTSNADWEKLALKETVQNAAGGLFAFTEIDFDIAGDQFFIVVEKNGGQTIDGVTYDDALYLVWVAVTDDLKGQLHATIHIYDEEGVPQDKILFVNVYEVTGDASVTLSGEKFIDGRDFKEGESFSFELYEADENYNVLSPALSVAAMDSATHRYEFVLNYAPEDVGKTFYYVVKEVGAAGVTDGLAYSDASHRIAVEVRDDGTGGIETVTTILNVTASTLNFTNVYTAAPAELDLDGGKTLEVIGGTRALKAGDFTFELYEANANFEIEGAPLYSVKNDESGEFVFEDISFAEAGTYFFVVKENTANPIGGVEYDNAVYHVTVTVSDDTNGQLVVTGLARVKVKGESSEQVEEIEFVNEYRVSPVEVTILGTKEITGRDLAEGEFKFVLSEADEVFNVFEGAAEKSTVNDADGDFSFEDISFAEVGTYFFVIYEDATVEAERVTFDGAVYHVSIEVTDDENGNLVASAPVIVKKGGTGAIDTIEFHNVYTPRPADITVEIDVIKTVVNKGSDKIGPEGFEFLLKDPTADGAEGLVVTSDENGRAKFVLTFTEDDIGSTFLYQLIEVNGKRANVTYSTVEYAISVTVSLSEENTLVATMTMNEVEAAELVAEFENTYDYTSEVPVTGDHSNLEMWSVLMFISGGAVLTLCFAGKKRERTAA